MTFDEFIGDWDKGEYAASLRNLDENQLRKLHDDIRQKVMRADASTGAAGASVILTSGFSIFGAGIGYRKRRYNAQKQEMIETRMREMEWETSRRRKRDILKAIAPSALAAAFVPGVDSFADHLLDHAAGDGAQYFVSNHTGDLLDAALHNNTELFQGISDGVSAQVGTVFNAVSGDATHLVPLGSLMSDSTAFLGNMAGQALAHTAEVELASSLAKGGIFLGIDNLLGSKAFGNTTSVSTRTSINKTLKHTESSVPVKQYKRGRKSELQFDVSSNFSRDEQKDWTDNMNSNGGNKSPYKKNQGSKVQTMQQTKSQEVVVPQKHSIEWPRNTQGFVIALYPALINSLFGCKATVIANLLPLAYCYRYSAKPDLITALCYISLPVTIVSLFGTEVLWFATFCLLLRFLLSRRTYNIEVTESYEVALVFLPLIFCTSGMLCAFVSGICSIAILGALTELCVLEKDFYAVPERFVFYLDYHSLYMLVWALFTKGFSRSFFSGCAFTAFVLSILQFIDGKIPGTCFLAFRKFLVKDLNLLGRIGFLLISGGFSGMICLLAGAGWFWFVLVGGLVYTTEKLHQSYGDSV